MHLQKPPLGTPLDWENPLNKGLVMHLAMNEGHGDVVQDLSINGNHGTLNNFAFPPTVASGWNPGYKGIGLNFDGANDHINCGKVIAPADKITMSLYVRYGADPATFNGMLLSKVYCNIYSRSISTEIRSEITTAGGAVYASIPFSSSDPYAWNLITSVYDGTTTDIYLNGNYIDGNPQTGDIVDLSTHNLEVGQKPGDVLQFNGNLDQVRVQLHAMTAKEVKDYTINPWQVYLDE